MDTLPPVVAPDPGYLRTRAAYHHLIHTLGGSLPPPMPDTPEARYQRDQAAIAQIAALCPANVAEATLAAQFVAASAQAMDCLRLTHDLATPPAVTLKCNAQAALMMRQAQGAMRTLLRVQAERRKANADEAAWTEFTVGQMMTESLTDPAPASAPEPPPSPVPPAEPPQLLSPRPLSPRPLSPEQAQPGQMSPDEVQTYIHLYPQRAAAIHQAGGMPGDASFPPPDDGIVHALTSGAYNLIK